MSSSNSLDHVWEQFLCVPLIQLGLTDSEMVRFQSRIPVDVAGPFPYARPYLLGPSLAGPLRAMLAKIKNGVRPLLHAQESDVVLSPFVSELNAIRDGVLGIPGAALLSAPRFSSAFPLFGQAARIFYLLDAALVGGDPALMMTLNVMEMPSTVLLALRDLVYWAIYTVDGAHADMAV